MKVKALVALSYLTLGNLMEYSLPGSSVHGILQARILYLNFTSMDLLTCHFPWPPPFYTFILCTWLSVGSCKHSSPILTHLLLFLKKKKQWKYGWFVGLGFLGGSDGKECTWQCRIPRFSPWVGKIPWGRKWQPTPVFLGFPGGSAGKESACNGGDLGLIPGLRRSPREGKGCPTPGFWPGEFHWLYSPWGRKELDTTDWLSL